MTRMLAIAALILALSSLGFGQTPNTEPAQPLEADQISTAPNELLFRALKAGNEAVAAKRYDEAIQYYDQGLAIAPKEPAFLINKSAAILLRGVASYNAALKSRDEADKAAMIRASHRDLREASDLASQVVGSLNTLRPVTSPEETAKRRALRLMALRTRAEALRVLVTTVDPTQAVFAVAAYREFLDAETDPARKLKDQLLYGRLLLVTNADDTAAREFQKILADDPQNIEALLGAGLSLINVGYSMNIPVKLQKGLDYLQQFIEIAPETNRLKASAEAALNYLKQEQQAKANKATGVVAIGPVGESNGPQTDSGLPSAKRLPDGVVVNGKVISKPPPAYPPIAKAARASGTVTVQIIVDEEGKVISAHAVSGHPLLQAAAVAAAREAKFTTTTLGDRPVKVSGAISYNFVLRREAVDY